uniref:EOG090X0EO1 n=1 Tax=Moina brachiata TaxID=675436 RepID=A0A4Y7NJ95_9CRUS|nr:EOG090X0EO1 [Moina brachiata]SVE93290.1 EOG090X0EO1 [Moina brachiata]
MEKASSEPRTNSNLFLIVKAISKRHFLLSKVLQSIHDENRAIWLLVTISILVSRRILNIQNVLQNLILLVAEDEEEESKEELERYKNQLISLQSSFRKANVQSQLLISSKNKEELFYSNPANMEVRSRQGKGKEDLIKMSTNVTENLRNLTQSMANIVEQSKGTLEVLEQSSRAVTENQDELKVMGGALVTTKKLVSRYVRKENTTTIITIFAALAFFLACVYVIQKRLF